MRNIKNTKGFTLVELLVVITILAIISVVAYQNFGGAVDKAVSGRKINDVSTIETSLQQYKSAIGYYPAVDQKSTTNMWGYDSGTATIPTVAIPSNTLDVNYNGQEISAIVSATGGGIVYGSGTLGQIGAKGTISMNTLGKAYLTKDLYDPELGDLKVGTAKLIDSGIGRYVYAVYKKPMGTNTVWGTNNKSGTYYNIAYTVKKEGSDTYLTKIVGDYDENSCFDDKALCPNTLIGTFSGGTILKDGQEMGKSNTGSALPSFTSTDKNQGIPYPVKDFQ